MRQKRTNLFAEPSVGIHRNWLALWGLLIATGLLWMTAFSMSPGLEADPLLERPAQSMVFFSEDVPTLVLFLHPRCPCTQPTMGALKKLISRKHDMVVQPVFYLPGTMEDSWARADYWDRVIALGAHQPMIDVDGAFAKKFHVTTSGHAILFSVDGSVLYSGGITGGRVHEGDNMGLTKLNRVLDGVPVEDPRFPVYGCSIVKKERSGHEH